MGKIAASVSLKLFINGNDICHTTDSPLAHKRDSIFKCKQHTFHDHRELENYYFIKKVVQGDNLQPPHKQPNQML